MHGWDGEPLVDNGKFMMLEVKKKPDFKPHCGRIIAYKFLMRERRKGKEFLFNR